MSTTDDHTDDLGNAKVQLSDGSALFALPYDPDANAESIKREIGTKTASETRKTPDPTSDDGDQALNPHEDGGPLRRFNDIKSPLGSVGLESLAKDEDELAKAIAARSDEIYRNEFPVIVPKFEKQCEQCGAEYDQEEIDICDVCGYDGFDEPDPSERREIKDRFERVNKEGQSMRQVGKITDEDHSRLGVLCWVLKWTYLTGPRTVSTQVSDAQRVIDVQYEELQRGDPKRIVPVVDENGRVGGVWWTCPLHRAEALIGNEQYESGNRFCSECGCDLREVHYVELEGARDRQSEKFYFEHEVVMFAGHIPQPHGLDGLSPVHLVWLEQAILHWMDVYAAEYFNPYSDKTPGKFIIFHTANPDDLDDVIDEAKEEAKANPGKGRAFPTILYDRIGPQQNAESKAEVIDVIDNEFLGQSEELRKRYENHIRTVFGVTDVFDSELEDAGGLNNEGLQLEVTDRSIAAAQQDYTDGPYDELLRYWGFEDWKVKFVPPREQDLEEQRQAVALLRDAAEIGLPARMENGEPVIGDGEAEAPAPEPAGPGFPDGGEDGLSGDEPEEVDVPPPGEDNGGESGNASADDLDEALQVLEDGFKEIVWSDLDASDDIGQKAEPFWDRDEDMPEFVKEMIREALRAGAVQTISDKLPAGTTRADVESFFRDQLSQPAGWSIRSLTENYAERFDVDPDDAVAAVRTQSASVLNEAREQGYKEQGDTDDRLFKWIGPGSPDDGRTTDACVDLKTATDPRFGGEPVPLDELKQMVENARREHFPEFSGSEWVPHFSCRHTYVEHFN